MATVAAMVESRAAVAALRRSLPRSGPTLSICRAPGNLSQLLRHKLVEALVVSPRAFPAAAIRTFRTEYPAIPVIAYAAFRPDDGELLIELEESGVGTLVVEGVDDAVVGDLILRASLTAARRQALADAPRALRLTEPLQLEVWNQLLARVDQPLRTDTLARKLGVSREHLSRQFGAGGAPNLKRVIDLTRIVCASQLLANAGYTVAVVARILSFASSSHLSDTARRICGATARALPAMGPRGVLAGFVKGKTRSRM